MHLLHPKDPIVCVCALLYTGINRSAYFQDLFCFIHNFVHCSLKSDLALSLVLIIFDVTVYFACPVFKCAQKVTGFVTAEDGRTLL